MAFTKPNVNNVWANAGDVISPAGAKINQGWIAEIPAYEFENWIQNRQDQFNAHVNQYGIVVWDNSTEYQAGRSYVQGSDGVVYKAKQTHIGQNPTTDSLNTYWEKAFDTFGTAYTKSESDNLYLKKSNNLSDVASVASVRSNLSVYSKVESDGRYLRKSLNLSDIQDVTIARDNLNAYSKSDVYTKSESDARYLNEASNLADVPDKGVARSNLDVYSRQQVEDAVKAVSIGWGQSWLDMSSARIPSQTYQNTTGKPIQVAITEVGDSDDFFYIDNVLVSRTRSAVSTDSPTTCHIVPSGSTYRLEGRFQTWAEMR